ncbi:hypothetical protein X798_07209 [Onchocerca flexuosa]|uniref:Uncharacterized protein n=1 Tax=Onchocerca flexuosa TaxID=387005 RepID=A0A238BL83_9BILA|nr:hypothetical protein X798_07209 [Onchocerca flexuosa]
MEKKNTIRNTPKNFNIATLQIDLAQRNYPFNLRIQMRENDELNVAFAANNSHINANCEFIYTDIRAKHLSNSVNVEKDITLNIYYCDCLLIFTNQDIGQIVNSSTATPLAPSRSADPITENGNNVAAPIDTAKDHVHIHKLQSINNINQKKM